MWTQRSGFNDELRECQAALGEALYSMGDLTVDNGRLSVNVQALVQKYGHTRSTLAVLSQQLSQAIVATEAAIRLKDETVAEMRQVTGEAQARVAKIQDASRLDRATLINAALRSLHQMRAQVAATSALQPAMLQAQSAAPSPRPSPPSTSRPNAQSQPPPLTSRPPRTAASTFSATGTWRRGPLASSTHGSSIHASTTLFHSEYLLSCLPPHGEPSRVRPVQGPARQWQPRGQVTVLNLEGEGEGGATTTTYDALRARKHRWGAPAPPTNPGAAAEAEAILLAMTDGDGDQARLPLEPETRAAPIILRRHRAQHHDAAAATTVPASCCPEGGASCPRVISSPRAAKGRQDPHHLTSATPFSHAIEECLRAQGGGADGPALPRLPSNKQSGLPRCSHVDLAPPPPLSPSPPPAAVRMYPP